jgi:hypothetical protein
MKFLLSSLSDPYSLNLDPGILHPKKGSRQQILFFAFFFVVVGSGIQDGKRNQATFAR